MRRRGLLVCTLFFSLASVRAASQARVGPPTVAPPSSSFTSIDDPFATTVNPALLPWLPSWGVAATHIEANEAIPRTLRGDSLVLAAPLWFGLGGGIAVESIRPTRALGAYDFGALTLGLGWQYDARWSFGAAARGYIGVRTPFDGVFAFDASVVWRPLDYLALTLIARDITGTGYALPFNGRNAAPRSLLLGAALRPLGTRELLLEGSIAVDAAGDIGARGLVDIPIPAIGRAYAAFEVERAGRADAAWTASAGLSISAWGATVVGGPMLTNGDADRVGWAASARYEGVSRGGFVAESRSFVLDLELRSLDERGLLQLAGVLERAVRSDDVEGLLLRVRGTGIATAYAQELRLLLDAFMHRPGRSPRPVVCHLASASGSELYACAGATRTVIDPAGTVRLAGPAADLVLLGDALERLGVRADFLRIGEYKSAPEQFASTSLSAPSRANRDSLMDSVYGRFVDDLGMSWGREPAVVRDVIDRGPFLAPEALSHGIVHALVDENEIDRTLADAGATARRRASFEPAPPTRWGSASRIGVVVIDGEIVDGRNVDIPFVGIHLSGGDDIVGALGALAADPTIAAIVIRIDTPGGSALASDQIWRAVRRARAAKPVIASLGAVAASGGYYAASACDEIWADPSTVTGSIGIFFGKVDVSALAARIGVRIESIRRGRHAGAESLYRPFSSEERAELAQKVRRLYRTFLERVSVGRGLTPQEVHRLGRGRVWTGDQAQARGLVDRLGGFASALVRARELGGLPSDAGFITLPRRPRTLLDYVTGGLPAAGFANVSDGDVESAAGLIDLPVEVRTIVRSVIVLGAMREPSGLARAPFDVVID